MAGFRITIPLTRDLHQQQQQQSQASLHQQQQQRQAPPQQSDQNLQFSLAETDDEADPYIPFLSEASPPPQHQDNLASADPAVNMNMPITGSELVSGETPLDLFPVCPSFTVSHPRGSGGETSLSLVPGAPSFTVSHPRGSSGETSLVLVTGGPSFTVNPPSGSPGRVKKIRERRGPPSSSANSDKLQVLGSTGVGVGVGFTPHIFIILPGDVSIL